MHAQNRVYCVMPLIAERDMKKVQFQSHQNKVIQNFKKPCLLKVCVCFSYKGLLGYLMKGTLNFQRQCWQSANSGWFYQSGSKDLGIAPMSVTGVPVWKIMESFVLRSLGTRRWIGHSSYKHSEGVQYFWSASKDLWAIPSVLLLFLFRRDWPLFILLHVLCSIMSKCLLLMS